MSDKITIKTIQERLAVPITGTFIETELGVAPVERDKRAVLWADSQYPEICDKLIAHIQARRSSTAVAQKAPAKPKKGETEAKGDFDFGAAETSTAPTGDSNGFDFGGGDNSVESSFNFGGEQEDTGFKF